MTRVYTIEVITKTPAWQDLLAVFVYRVKHAVVKMPLPWIAFTADALDCLDLLSAARLA